MGKPVLWGQGCNSGSCQSCEHIQVTMPFTGPSTHLFQPVFLSRNTAFKNTRQQG